MSVQKIGVTDNIKRSYDVNPTSHVGKCAGFVTGAAVGSGLVYSQMSSLRTINGKKNLLEKFYLDLEKPEDAPKRTVLKNKEGKFVLPKDGVHERSKIIARSHRRYYMKWGAFITLITTGLGCLADRSITAVNKKEFAESGK